MQFIQELVVTLPVHTTRASQDMTLPFHGRGYLVDTGQEFVNTRGPGGNAEPFQFDTGMGVLPEAIDMTGEHCFAWCTCHMSEMFLPGLHVSQTYSLPVAACFV